MEDTKSKYLASYTDIYAEIQRWGEVEARSKKKEVFIAAKSNQLMRQFHGSRLGATT